MPLLSAGDLSRKSRQKAKYGKAHTLHMPRVHQQDTHFKFLHGAHQTNWYLQNVLRDRPNTSPACNACGKTESLAHAFFECEEAYKIWREIKPKLSEILDGKNIQCFKLALKIFPPETTLAEKKMLTTIVQIAMHQIWLNRNFRKHERPRQNTQSSLNSIDWTFCKNIKQYLIFNIYKKNNANYPTQHT